MYFASLFQTKLEKQQLCKGSTLNLKVPAPIRPKSRILLRFWPVVHIALHVLHNHAKYNLDCMCGF